MSTCGVAPARLTRQTPRPWVAARSTPSTGSSARSTTGTLGSPTSNGAQLTPSSVERKTPTSVATYRSSVLES